MTYKNAKTEIRRMAVEFVRKNNCAVNTPVGLIEAAMEEGAGLGVEIGTRMVGEAHKALVEIRRKNIG